MVFIFNLSLFLVTFIGALLPNLRKRTYNEDVFNRLLLFAGAFLFAVCLSHLIPESVVHYGTGYSGILIVVGFFAQFIIQHFSHGVDHGHRCHHLEDKKYIWSLFLAMALHSFFEGLPLSTGFFSMNSLIPVYLAIALHKIPSAMIIYNIFYNASKDKKYSVWVTFLFSLITPVAALIGYVLSKNITYFDSVIPYIIPLVAGSLLQIATTIFFEASGKHHIITRTKWIVIILGAGIGCMSGLMHSH